MLQHIERPTLQQIFRPINTGSPRQDVYHHLSHLPQLARLDFEDHVVVGNTIVRIEPDLGSATEQEQEARIVSVTYAERIFGNLEDAVEFIRSVKLIAGIDARARELQTIASHYYKEAKSRPANEVLKEMALLAMQLSSVTANEEECLFGDPVEIEMSFNRDALPGDEMSLSDRRAEWMHRAARVLGEAKETDIFGSELRAASSFKSHVSGFAYDEFIQHLADCEALTETAEEADELHATYEAVYEQYREDHVTSLHMTDGERVVVVGTLDDDIDENSLPEEARHLASELRRLYVNGTPLDEIYEWMETAINFIYHERTVRTTRVLVSINGQTIDLPRSIKVCPYAEERAETRSILEKLLEQCCADFHYRACHTNSLYRSVHRRIRSAPDASVVAATIKEAYQAKEDGRLTLAHFTALNTAAKSQYLKYEPAPLPLLVRERLMRHLMQEIKTASPRKLTFLRWAMYRQNKPDHLIHHLQRADKAFIWDALKARTATQLNLLSPAA